LKCQSADVNFLGEYKALGAGPENKEKIPKATLSENRQTPSAPQHCAGDISARSLIITFSIPLITRRNSWDREIGPNRGYRIARNGAGMSAWVGSPAF